MTLQVEHTVQHYTSYCQRHGKLSKIAMTAFLHFMVDTTTIRSNGQDYCISQCILVQMTNAHSIREIKIKFQKI